MSRVVLVGIESLDILDECHDATAEDENEGDDAQSSNDVQSNEHISSGWKHGCREKVRMKTCTEGKIPVTGHQ